jgi:hypothetical protein
VVSGGESAMAGRRRGGGHRLGVHGAAEVAVVMEEHVSGWRWCSTGSQPRQMKEVAGSVLQRFLAADGGSAAGLAWLRGAREWCTMVSASTLGAEEHGDEGAEADSERQSGLGGCSATAVGRGENGFSFGPAA